MAIKTYGANRNQLIAQAFGTAITNLEKLQEDRYSLIQELFDRYYSQRADFFGNLGAISVDAVGSLFGGIWNGVFDMVSGGQLIWNQFVNDVGNENLSANEANRWGYAFGNAFTRITEGTQQFLGGALVDGARIAGDLYRLFDPKGMQQIDTFLSANQVVSRTNQGDASFYGKLTDLINYYGPGGAADTIGNYWSNVRAEMVRDARSDVIGGGVKNPYDSISSFFKDATFLTQDEIEENKKIVESTFGSTFLKQQYDITNASAARRKMVDDMLQNQYVTNLIQQGGVWGDSAQFVRGVATSVGRILPTMMIGASLGKISKALNLSAKGAQAFATLGKVAGNAYFGSSIFGMSMEEALQNGTSYDDSLTYAFGSAMSEMVVEASSGFVIGEAMNINTFKGLLKQMLNEGIEETVAELGSRGLGKYNEGTVGTNVRPESAKDFYSRTFLSALSGAVSGGVLGSGSFISSNATFGNRAKALQASLAQNIEEIGVENFAKDAAKRLDRTLKDLNNEKISDEAKKRVIERSPLLQRVFKYNKKTNKYEFTEAGKRIKEGQVLAVQGKNVINKEKYAISNQLYLETIRQTVSPEKGKKVKVNVLDRKTLKNLPAETQARVNDALKNFDNVIFVNQKESDFEAFTDPESGAIYINVNSKKGFASLYAHEVHDYLTELAKKGRLNPQAAKALQSFQQQFYSKEALDAFIKKMPKKYVEILNFVRENYDEKDVPREFISKVIEDVLVASSSDASAINDLIKANNPTVMDFLKNLVSPFVTNLIGKGLGSKSKGMMDIIDSLKQNFGNVLRLSQEQLQARETIRMANTFQLATLYSLSEDDLLNDAVIDFATNIDQKIIVNNVNVQTAYKEFVNRLYDNNFQDGPEFFKILLKRVPNSQVFEIGSKERDAGYLFKVNDLHFSKNLMQQVYELNKNKQIVIDNINFDYIKNLLTFEANIVNETYWTGIANPEKPKFKIGKKFTIGGDIVDSNMNVIKSQPLIATSGLNSFVLDSFIQTGVLPSQSFTVNHFGYNRSPVSQFSRVQREGAVAVKEKDAFYPLVVLRDSVLAKKDMLIGKEDIYTPTRRMYQEDIDKGVYQLYFNQVGEGTFGKTGIKEMNLKDTMNAFKLTIDYVAQARKQFGVAETINEDTALKQPFDPEVNVEGLASATTAVAPEATKQKTMRMLDTPQDSMVLMNIISVSERLAQIRQNPRFLKEQILKTNFLRNLPNVDSVLNKFAEASFNMTSYFRRNAMNFQEFRVILQTFIEQKELEGNYKGVEDALEQKSKQKGFGLEKGRVMDLFEQLENSFRVYADLYQFSSFGIDEVSEGKVQLDIGDVGALVLIRSVNEPNATEAYQRAVQFAQENNIEVLEVVQKGIYERMQNSEFSNSLSFEEVNRFLVNVTVNKNDQKLTNNGENEILFSKAEKTDGNTIASRINNDYAEIADMLDDVLVDAEPSNAKKAIAMMISFVFNKFDDSVYSGLVATQGEKPSNAAIKASKHYFETVVTNAILRNQQFIFNRRDAISIIAATDTFINLLTNPNLATITRELTTKSYASPDVFAEYIKGVLSEDIAEQQGIGFYDVFDAYNAQAMRLDSLDFLSYIFDELVSGIRKNHSESNYAGILKNIYPESVKNLEQLYEVFSEMSAVNELQIPNTYISNYFNHREIAKYVADSLKVENNNIFVGSLAISKEFKDSPLFDKLNNFDVVVKVPYKNKQSSYYFGFDSFKFVLPSNQMMTNVKLNKASVPFFTFNVLEVDSETRTASYFQNRIIAPTLITANGKVIENPMKLEFGIGEEKLRELALDAKPFISQSVAVAPLASENLFTDFFSRPFNINDKTSVKPIVVLKPNALELRSNILQPTDWFTPLKVNDTLVVSRPQLREDDTRYLNLRSVLRTNVDLASIALAEIIESKDYIEDETFYTEYESASNLINISNLEEVLKSFFIAGQSDLNLTDNNLQAIKEKIQNHLRPEQQQGYIDVLTETYRTIQEVATEFLNQNDASFVTQEEAEAYYSQITVKNFVRTAAAAINDLYEEYRGNLKPTYQRTLIHSYNFNKNQQKMYEIFKTYFYMNETNTTGKLFKALESLPFRMRAINEAKFSSLEVEDIGMVALQVYSTSKEEFEKSIKSEQMKTIVEGLNAKGIRVKVIDQSQFANVEMNAKKEAYDKIQQVVGLYNMPSINQTELQSLISLYAGQVDGLYSPSIKANQDINETLIEEADDLLFSKSQRIKNTRKKKTRALLDGKKTTVKKQERIVPQQFEDTKEQEAEVKKTRTKVSKSTFKSEYSQYGKKDALYNQLTKVLIQLRALLDAQRKFKIRIDQPRTTADGQRRPQYQFEAEAEILANAIVNLNNIKSKIENLMGINTPVSPYDKSIPIDEQNNPALISREVLETYKEDVADFTSKEQQTQTLIDTMEAQLLAMQNQIKKELVDIIDGNTTNEANVVVQPIEVALEPGVFEKLKDSQEFKKLMQLVRLYTYLTDIAEDQVVVRRGVSTQVNNARKVVMEQIRSLINISSMPIRDPFVFTQSPTFKKDYPLLLTQEQDSMISKAMTNLFSTDFTAAEEGKKMLSKAMEDVQTISIDTSKEAGKTYIDQKAKESAPEQRVFFERKANNEELAYFWYEINRRREKEIDELILKAESQKEINVLRKLKSTAALNQRAAKKLMSKIELKNAKRNAKVFQEALANRQVTDYDSFKKQYAERFKVEDLQKTQAEIRKEEYERARKPEGTTKAKDQVYVGPEYVSLQDLRFSPGIDTPIGRITFTKPKTLTKKGKLFLKEGVEITIKGKDGRTSAEKVEKQTKYFFYLDRAQTWLNQKIHSFVRVNKLENQLAINKKKDAENDVQPMASLEKVVVGNVVDEVAVEPDVVEEMPVAPTKKPKQVWIPKADITFEVNGVPQVFTAAQAKAMLANGQWNFESEQQFLDYQTRVIEVMQQQEQQKQDEAQQSQILNEQRTRIQATGKKLGNANTTQPTAATSDSKNIFRRMVNIALNLPKDNYKKQERRFAIVKDKVVDKLSKSKKKAEQAVWTVWQRLNQTVTGYANSNRMYNHMSSAVAKELLLNLTNIFTVGQNSKANTVIVPTKAQLQMLERNVIAAIFGTLDYIDENLKVKINVSETNPNGFLFTRGAYWYLREMLKVENWDRETSDLFASNRTGNAVRRLVNAIRNYNQAGFGMNELASAMEEFDLATAVEPVTDLALKQGSEARTVATTAPQWINNARENREIQETAGIDVKPNGVSLFDPYTIAEIVSLFDNDSWGMVLFNKIIQGQDRAFEVARAFDGIFSEEWQKKNNKNLVQLEKTTVKVENLGGIQVPMSQVITLRNTLFREIVRNRLIDLGIIEGEKTNHFENGFETNILAITEIKEKKQRLQQKAKIRDKNNLLQELDTIINGNAFAKSYNQKVYEFINGMYPYVNERFKEIQGANLVNDGLLFAEKLSEGMLSKQQIQQIEVLLPKGMKLEDIPSQMYMPFLLNSGSYFKGEKLNFSDVLDMGVFDGMTREVTDNSGVVSIESITNVIQAYNQEVQTYYGYHRIMRDMNIIFNYRFTNDNGQEVFVESELPKWATDYFQRLIMDSAGYTARPVDDTFVSKWLPVIRRNFYTAALGVNFKVVFSQFATFFNLWNIYGEGKADFIAKMTANLAKRATKGNKAKLQSLISSNNFYWDRSSGGTFEIGETTKEGVRAKGIVNTLKEFSMKGITLTDNMINEAFYLTLLETVNPATNQRYTPAEASKMLTMALIRSQSSKQAIAKSSLLRSKNELVRIMVKFAGEPLKHVSQLASSAFQLSVIRKLKKSKKSIINKLDGQIAIAERRAEKQRKELERIQAIENSTTFATESETFQEKVRDEIEREERKLQEEETRARDATQRRDNANARIDRIIAGEGKASRLAKGRIAAVLTSMTHMVFLAIAFEALRGTLDEDKEPDEEMWSFLMKRIGAGYLEEMVGLIPFARDIYQTVVNGYEFGEIGELGAINTVASALNGFFRAFAEGESVNMNRTIYNLVVGIGQLFGVNVKGLERFVTTPLQYIDPAGYYNYRNFIGAPDRDNIELVEAIKNEDLNMISAIVDRKIQKRNIKIHVDIRNEMKRLVSKGFEVSITGIPDKLVEDGAERKLTSQEKEEFAEVYNKADFIVRKMMTSPSYRRLTDKYKARMIQAIYNYYYRYAKQDVLGIDTLSEEMTFVSLNEAYRYFLGRADSFRKQQIKDSDRNEPTILLN
jgi:hypothetical protein